MPVMTTTEYSAAPFATIALTESVDAVDAVLTALEQDRRVLGPVVGYDPKLGRLDAIFQVDLARLDTAVGATTAAAAKVATQAFDAALHAAGLDARTNGISVVEGVEPDLLP